MIRNIILTLVMLICVSAVKADYTNGVFFLNEDWYGHDYGSLNFYSYGDEEMQYRVFREVNPNEHFGITSQYIQIFGDKMYVVSKQDRTYGSETQSGGRLVVVDAKTLEKIAQIDEIGGADGRSFVGVNDEIGYIGTTGGIYTFDMKTYTVGKIVSGSVSESGGLYSSQIGDMIRLNGYVFATKQSEGVLVIDVNKHEVVETISIPEISTIFVSSAGELIAASESNDAEFVRIDTSDFSVENINLEGEGDGISVQSSWGAWKSGSVAVDPKENVIYYLSSEYSAMVHRLDLETLEFTLDYIDLSSRFEKQIFYGKGISIDPRTRKIALTTTERGYGSHFQENWVHFVNVSDIENIKTCVLDKYYWFPAMAVYPDNEYPIIDNAPIEFVYEEYALNPYAILNLKERVSDADNNNHLIQYDIKVMNEAVCNVEELEYGVYKLKALSNGRTSVVITADSNGHIQQQEFELNIDLMVDVDEVYEPALSIYPNPVVDKLTIEGKGNAAIYTVDGYLKTTFKVDGETTIDTSDYECGLYILVFNDGNREIVKRIIK